MLVTIYTDASFKEGSGSWAVYLISDQGKIKASGRTEKVRTNNIAEFMAIREGIAIAQQNWGDLITKIVVKTDSKMCCHMLWDTVKGGSKDIDMRSIKSDVIRMVSNIRFEIKHTRKDRNKLNTWCDREAKTTLNNI